MDIRSQDEFEVGQARRLGGTPRGRIGNLVAAGLAAIRGEIELRIATRQLLGADAAMLKDIGVGRGSVERAVRCGRDRKRSMTVRVF